MLSAEKISQALQKTLYDVWGYTEFREGQKDIIHSILKGNDTVALLPTGGGKSICYQLPALLLEGTCLVISPLLALMKDQVQQLKSRGIEAEFLSSELDEFQEEEILQKTLLGTTKLLYISPERLQNSLFLSKIEEVSISFIAVDEAHCISEWGQDFRPSYQNIIHFRKFLKHVPCLALTATATSKVLEEITQKLGFTENNIFKKSFKRNNIKILHEEVTDKYSHVLTLLKHHPSSGIIYTRTRREAEDLALFLKQQKINNVDFFHAGLSAHEKNSKQKKWLQSNHQVLISTNAFGMGIDKENVRFVVHFSSPPSLENYYQEIGRAGRDNEKSFAYLLWNRHELLQLDETMRNSVPSKQEFLSIVSYLYSHYRIAQQERPEQIFELHFSKIQTFTQLSLAKIKNVLQFLHHQELIFLKTTKGPSRMALKFNAQELESLPSKTAYVIELLLRSLDGLSTHKVFFNELTLAQKIGVDPKDFKEKLTELRQKDLIEYTDGSLHSIRFLCPRDDQSIEGKWWNLFFQIQKNKLQKWEEMKFFIQQKETCRMKLILTYFGEKENKNCQYCDVCDHKNRTSGSIHIERQIIEVLQERPASLEDLAVILHYPQREKLQQQLIFLLELGKIKMLDFRTYTLP